MSNLKTTAAVTALFTVLSGTAFADKDRHRGNGPDVNQRTNVDQTVIIDQRRTGDRTINRTTNNRYDNRQTNINPTATGGNLTVGDIEGSSADSSSRSSSRIGNVTGGDSSARIGDIEGSEATASIGDVAGGSATGVGSVEVEGDTVTVEGDTYKTEYEAAAATAYAPNMGNGGDCPEGFSIGVQVVKGGVSGGKTSQDKTCMAHMDARYVLGTGAAENDKAMQAYGLLAIDELNQDQYGSGPLQRVQENLECADSATSALALTKENACPSPE